MAEPLSKVEEDILDYLVEYLRENTYQPSIREIGRRFDIKSTKTVSEHLQALARKGYLQRDAARSRGVKILGLDLAANSLQLPLYGKVAAGDKPLQNEGVTGRVAVDRQFVSSPDTFALRVDGESMEGAGIHDGDFVLVDPAEQEELHDGDTVAVRAGGKPLVKQYYDREGEVVLQPANPDHPPIVVREVEDFAVLGKVVGLYRNFGNGSSGAHG